MRVGVHVGGVGEQAHLDVPADQGGDPHHGHGRGVEAGHPVTDDVAHGGRHLGPPDGFRRDDPPVGGEQPGQLTDEERVARRAGMNLPGDTVVGIMAGLPPDQLRHLVRRQRDEPEPAVTG